MKKNVASQVVSAVVVSATDGSAVTASVSVTVTGDAGTQGAGGGTLAHEGGGEWSYVPTQAETNFDHIMFKFSATGAVPVGIQVYTTFPQTGDNFARLGAPAGASHAADIAAVKNDTAATLTDTAEIGAAGAGLTALPWSAAWDAEVQSEVNDGLVAFFTSAAQLVTDVWAAGTRSLTDKAGFALSAAGVQAIWDALTAALTTANSIGKLLVDNVNATISSRASQASVDTIDGIVDSILAAVDTEIAAILEDTGTTLDDLVDDLESRLTAALATALQAHGLGLGRGVVDASSTTTAVIFKTVNGAAASAVDDHFNGRHIVFTSGALALQQTSISDYDGTTKTATVPALTSAPAEDVTFLIV